jgi:hypothetical protein
VASNLASVNNFAEVYRIESSAPTTSLDLGDLYFDTTSDTLKVYGASGWQNAGSSINGTSQRYHYDISGTPTSVTGADANGNTLTYDAGYVDVYVNGVRMSDADITVTSGDTVTFAEALADGDEVDIVGFGTFSVASLNADNLDSGTVPSARVSGAYTGITSVGTLTSFASTGIDDNASSTAITLDSSNNLLVGTTNVSPANGNVQGIALKTNNAQFSANANNAITANRMTSDGNIIILKKSGSDVGSIGVNGSNPFLANSSSRGISLGGNVVPCDSSGVKADNVSDLGIATGRFKDLYLSGGVYLGGTGSANKLDDYEEGTWTPGIGNFTVNSGTWAATGRYVKVGNAVTVTLFQTGGNVTWTTSQRLTGLPFTPTLALNGAGTWTNGSPNAGGQVFLYSNAGLYFAQGRSNETELTMTATYVITD